MVSNDSSQSRNGLRARLAERTGTSPEDWFLVHKARYGLKVVFDVLAQERGAGDVACQLFTCCTAVDPIVAAGLHPRYEEVSMDSLALDPHAVNLDDDVRALMVQHTFGIVDDARSQELASRAHEQGSLVVEDCAHCLARMARDEQGRPLADVSAHSFGSEKVLPSTYFGGAIWLNPAMEDVSLREKMADALSSLPELEKEAEKATHSYHNQIRVLTRVPASTARVLRARWTKTGFFEPAVGDVERAGGLFMEPALMSDWVAEQALLGMEGIAGFEEGRRACTRLYAEQLAGTKEVLIPSDICDVVHAQPLLRYPVFLRDPQMAKRVIAAIAALGLYAVDWYAKPLYPGALDWGAYGLDVADPKMRAYAQQFSSVVALPTDIPIADACRVVEAVREVVAQAPAGISAGASPLEMLRAGAPLADHLAPVCIGGDILGYSYVRCFHEAYGLRSIVLSSIDVKMTSSSKLCDYRIVPGMNDEAVLLDYLRTLGFELATQGKVGLLVGAADWHARFLSSHKDELAPWFVVPYIDFELLDEITQKERFYEICEELGIAYPHTWYLDCSDADAVLDASDFPYPLIAKPSNSASYDLLEFRGKKKIYEIETPEELVHTYDIVRAAGYKHKLVVQDFVPGDDDAIRSLTVFANEEGELRVASGGRVVLQDHSPLALGNPVCILSERVEPILEGARTFLKHVGYRGWANFDIKYDSRDGSYRFFEVNTRLGRNSYYVTLGGVNFVVPLVEMWVLGHDVEPQEAYDEFVYTLIPPVVVRKTVTDEDLRDHVLDLYRTNVARSPMDNPDDAPAQRLWWQLYYRHQVSKFKKYVWDTGGKQASTE